MVWSDSSVESDWVLEEAGDARDRNVLIPVFIDQVQPPLGFRRLQALDLTAWSGHSDSADFRRLVTDMERILGVPPVAPRRTADSEQAAKPRAAADHRVEPTEMPENAPAADPDPWEVDDAGLDDEATVVGYVTHYYGIPEAATVLLTDGLEVGDYVHIAGANTEFYQRVESIQIDLRPTRKARAGAEIGLKVDAPVLKGDVVYSSAASVAESWLRADEELGFAVDAVGLGPRRARHVGRVNHFYDRMSVAVVELTDALACGDDVLIRGTATDFWQTVESIHVNRKPADRASAGTEIGLKVNDPVGRGDDVYRLV